MNMSLSARLTRAGIEAALCTQPIVGGEIKVSFLLCEAEDIAGAERIPGAAVDREKAKNGTIDAWEAQLEAADKTVCHHFGIVEKHVLINQHTGQVVLHVCLEGRTESCRWMQGIGWIGW